MMALYKSVNIWRLYKDTGGYERHVPITREVNPIPVKYYDKSTICLQSPLNWL